MESIKLQQLKRENEGMRAEIETLNEEIARLESFIACGNRPIKGIVQELAIKTSKKV